ncbi:MAG: bifunctional precorrin-2 dehydrogenase/sirohydrochlorin ferrochelatase [Kiloniellaceae bacterium]
MQYFPAFLDLNGKPCLVAGGGEIAARKVRLLRKAGAAVTVVAPRIGSEIAELAESGAVRVVRRGFVAGDARGRAVVLRAAGSASA